MPIANIASVISTLVTSLACIGEAYKNNRFYVACTPWIVLVAIIHCLDLHPNGIRYLSNNDQLVYDFIYYHSNRYYRLQSNRSHLKYRTKIGDKSRFLKIKNDLLEQHYEQLRQHIQEVNTLRLEFVQEMENLQDLMHTDQNKS